MLSADYLRRTLSVLQEFGNPTAQILQGSGFDGVIELLDSLRSVEFPCVVLEAGGSGNVQLVEGPVDTYTQSIWVMGRLGRGEEEAPLYARMKELARKVTAKLLQDAAEGVGEALAIDWTRYSYMQRWGGQNARGYELVFTLREDFSLLLKPSDLKPQIRRVSDYLYAVDFYRLNYRAAEKWFREHNPVPSVGACTSIAAGFTFGGNFDWFYDNEVEFVVRTPRHGQFHATLGVAGAISDLTREAVEQGLHEELHNMIPFFLNDGINDRGLYCKVNVVPNDYGTTGRTVPEGEQHDEICSTMLVRFVLDRFETAMEAVTYLRQHVSIYHPAKLREMGYEAHWMIADSEHSFVIEIIDSNIVVTESPIMTNFYLHDVTPNDDGTVWTPVDVADGHRPSDNGITPHGSGLERYNIAVRALEQVVGPTSMRELLDSLLYSRTYLSSPNPAEPIWHSEYVGGDLTVDSPAVDFASIETILAEKFFFRDRDIPATEVRTWHSSHSSVYDTLTGRLHLVSQEDKSAEHQFDLMNGDVAAQ